LTRCFKSLNRREVRARLRRGIDSSWHGLIFWKEKNIQVEEKGGGGELSKAPRESPSKNHHSICTQNRRKRANQRIWKGWTKALLAHPPTCSKLPAIKNAESRGEKKKKHERHPQARR